MTLQNASSKFSPSQLDVLHVVILSCCALSLLGCLYILRHHYMSARLPSGVSMVQKMVVVLSIMDAGLTFPKMFGHLIQDATVFCYAQAFSLHLFGLMSVFWNTSIAHCFYRKIVHKDSEARLKSRFKVYVLLAIVPAVGDSVALGAARMFGSATFYCWVESRMVRFWSFYLFVVVAIFYICVILWVTHTRMSRLFQNANVDAQESWALITSKLRIYIAAFIVLWIPSIIFRLFDNQLGSATFSVALLMQVTVCSQGLTTAIIYGGLLTKLYQILSCKPSIPLTHKCVASPSFPTMESGTTYAHVKHYRKPANLFVSTFNMGEAQVTPVELTKWIPRGHDIYVIGLQECLHLSTTRSLIRQHLEGTLSNLLDHQSSAYHQFDREIGRKTTALGYHGHIAITVFIKSFDVGSGAFYMPPVVQQEVHVGKSLVLGRASNKGAVGFAFRYYDTSFAFVACHLASDPKGKSNVRRRNRDSQDLLKNLHLNLEDVGFEFPFVHHHSFVLGDLNYRLTRRHATAETILELVSKVKQCENASVSRRKQQATLHREFLDKRSSGSPFGHERYRGSERESNPYDVSLLERNVKSTSFDFVSSNSSSTSARYSADCELLDDDQFGWDKVLAHDELHANLREGYVFYGFQEAPITFPPTFRRKRKAALNLDAANWTSEDLAKCFTTAIKGHGTRVPSYTDRILFFSQSDMCHRLRCVVYNSCEQVNCSDHKPVIAVFQALVNRDFMPMESQVANKNLQRMQDVNGVLECQLRVDFDSISWLWERDSATRRLPTDYFMNLNERFSTLNRHGHHVMVTIVYPLPSEDIFSAQRKLFELADSMCGGVYLNTTDRLLCKTNVAHVKWTDFVRNGLTHHTFVRPTGNMHVAIKVHAGAQGLCFGQGVICIPQATSQSIDSYENIQKFVVELGEGGRHTGTMSGTVSLQLIQCSSTR